MSIYINDRITGENGKFSGIASSDTEFKTKFIITPATIRSPVTIKPRIARNLPHLAAFKRKAAASDVNCGNSFEGK